ncbi:Uncharacterised protein g8663 [Pycnogonum litorale]
MGKRKCLSLDDKLKILNEVDEEKKKRKTEIAKEFDLPLSSSSTIIKNAEKIRSDKQSSSRKKIRACPNEELDQVLVKWFAEIRSSNSTVPVSGPRRWIVQRKWALMVLLPVMAGWIDLGNGKTLFLNSSAESPEAWMMVCVPTGRRGNCRR